MTYYSGFVCAVPTANRQAYVDHAAGAWPLFARYGALRMIEAWGEDVPRGKRTDFWRAVEAQEDETVVFSWIEWPDRATADRAFEQMSSDPEMANMGEMPFDGARMIWGGFAPVYDSAEAGSPADGSRPMTGQDK